MAIHVILSDDPARVLSEAGSFLASEPVLHNLILTLLHARIAYPEPGRYFVAWEGRRVVGLLFQSPLDLAANLAVMGNDAVAAIVDAVADAGVSLPGVNGEATTAARFAGQWTERRKSAAIPFRGERLYELAQVGERRGVDGHLRPATFDDRDLVIDWLRCFAADAGVGVSDPERQVERWIPAQQVWIWQNGEPVCMAVSRECVEAVVRLAFVYTPPERRSRGYAEACVGDLSRQILDKGQRAILYTDLGNPTSNSIYRRIGYRAVAEGLRYRFA